MNGNLLNIDYFCPATYELYVNDGRKIISFCMMSDASCDNDAWLIRYNQGELNAKG